MDLTTISDEVGAFGYVLQDTGGGDTAFVKDLGDNSFAMLTDMTGKSVPSKLTDEVMLAVYDTNYSTEERWAAAFSSLWAFLGVHTKIEPWKYSPQCHTDGCRTKPEPGSSYCAKCKKQ